MADQRLLQGQVTMLEDDLRQRKTEFEEKNLRVQTELKEALAEQQKTQVTMTKRCDDALQRAKIAEDRLATLEKSQERDSAL